MKKLYVIAGEASGDLHGSNLIREIKSQAKELVEIHGVGGEKIRATGALNFFDLAHFHVTGFTDLLKHLPDYANAEKIILHSVSEVRPDLVVLIDNPGFNLRLAKKIHAMNIPIVYYIPPQLWAWNTGRVHKIKAYVKKVLVLFEFEKKIYEDHGVPVEWVGHPLKDVLDDIHPSGPQKPLIALLPGSRRGELGRLFSIVSGAARKIAEKRPDIQFALIKAPTIPKEFYDERMAREMKGLRCTLVEKDGYAVIKHSDLAVVCSGTSTLECAILKTPMVITNKGTLLTYLLALVLSKVRYLGLPNLILGREAFREILQYRATPENLAAEALSILSDGAKKEAMEKDLEEVSRKVGGGGANRRAAEEVLKML